MAETLTPNYGWTKPDPGASANTWGATLNATTDKVDAQVFANQKAIAATGSNVGDMKMFAGATPPTNWAICDGSSQSTTGPMAALFAVIQYVFGGSGTSFNLPNAKDKMLIGAGGLYALGATGGEATHTLAAAEMPAHNHPVTDPQHYHVVAAYTHTHSVSDPQHTHGASGAEAAHAHGSNLLRFVGSGSSFGIQNAPGNVSAGNTDAAQAGETITINYAPTGISIQAAATGIPNTNYAYAGVTTQNAGGGAAHNNLPPYLAVNMIIRFA